MAIKEIPPISTGREDSPTISKKTIIIETPKVFKFWLHDFDWREALTQQSMKLNANKNNM